MDEPEYRAAAREADEELGAAIRTWLRKRAALGPSFQDQEYADDAPVLNGWVVAANYSTIKTAGEQVDATLYGAEPGQVTPMSLGLAHKAAWFWL